MKIIIGLARSCKSWGNYRLLNKNIMTKVSANIIARFSNLKQVKVLELSVLFADEEKISELNYKFRGKHNTTNVLSFPDIELDWRRLLEFKPNLDYMYLGDIAFCYSTIEQEAIEYGKLFEQHFLHLFVHSVLHLLGFDHQIDEDAIVMEDLETQILKDFSISSPYL